MKKLIALAAIALTFAQAAPAQIPTSSGEFRPNHAADAKIRGAIELDRLVRCAMSRRENLASNIIRSRPGSNAENLQLSQFRNVQVNCMTELAPAIWLGNVETRGAIAQTFYLRQYPTKPDFAVLAHPILPLPKAWLEGKISSDERTQLLGADFADCLVATAPDDADALLRTDLRSTAEGKVFRRLIPQIGPCLPKGLTMELDVAWLRAVVAQSLLRNVNQWQDAGPISKGGSA